MYLLLQKTGRYVCDIEKTANRDYDEYSFRDSYDWLASQMAERIDQPPTDVRYPVWAWYRNDDDYLRWGKSGNKYAKITLEIEPWRVVLSDYDAWNSVIEHRPVIYEDDDEKWNAEWERCMEIGKNAIEATWSKIFRSDAPYVQATFWELLKSDIIDIDVFTSKGYEQ